MEKERKKRIEAINHESPSDQPELARGSEAFHKGLASLYSHHLQCSATLVVSKCIIASLIFTKVNPEVLQTWPLLHLKEIFPDLPM